METQELPKTNATEKLEEVQSELQCTICHDYFVQASTLSCSHSFCFNCINAWRTTHTDCPVCRREIFGMAPSRALDNMVAAFVGRTNSSTINVQASLQQFGAWRHPTCPTIGSLVNTTLLNTGESDDTDSENDFDDWWAEYEDDEESYSDGSYDAEEEEIEDEEGDEDDWDEEAEEEEEDGSSLSNSDDDDEEEFSDDDEYDEHAKRSNENNPNNNVYWKLRGFSSRPDNWKELADLQ